MGIHQLHFLANPMYLKIAHEIGNFRPFLSSCQNQKFEVLAETVLNLLCTTFFCLLKVFCANDSTFHGIFLSGEVFAENSQKAHEEAKTDAARQHSHTKWRQVICRLQPGPPTYPDRKTLYPSTEIGEISVGRSHTSSRWTKAVRT